MTFIVLATIYLIILIYFDLVHGLMLHNFLWTGVIPVSVLIILGIIKQTNLINEIWEKIRRKPK